MKRRYRLLAVHLTAVLLPCVVIGLLGYQWLRLERDAEARRGREAAESELRRIRSDLFEHLTAVSKTVRTDWTERLPAWPPFAPPPPVPRIAAAAFLFDREGKLVFPACDTEYRQAIQNYVSGMNRPEWQKVQARIEWLEARGLQEESRQFLARAAASPTEPAMKSWALLNLGRLALARRDHAAALSHAGELLRCCSGVRDEYGVAFAFYAARQMLTIYERQRRLESGFLQLAGSLARLVKAGQIGHPEDVPAMADLAGQVRDLGFAQNNFPFSHPILGPSRADLHSQNPQRSPGYASGFAPSDRPNLTPNPGANSAKLFLREPFEAASELRQQTEQVAARVRRQIEISRQLEKWIAGSELTGQGDRLSMTSLRMDDTPQLVALFRGAKEPLVALIVSTDELSRWVAARSGQMEGLQAALAASGAISGDELVRTPLIPEVPAFTLAIRPKASEPLSQKRREVLFASAIGAALTLVLLTGYFAWRDFSRELRMAGLRAAFVAGVTHELKTPLASIRLLAETLQLKRTRDPAAAEELLGTIVSESERLSRLVDNVLSFSRLEKGTRKYQPVEVVLSEAVRDAAGRFQYILRQGGFRLLEEHGADGLRVQVDADALTESLLNLFSNAVKYSGRSREIRVAVKEHGREAEVSVSDHGLGIPSQEQKRIFESFYRSPQSAQETSGAGLGLALVRHFAEAHGGRVTVCSEPGKGSTFSLRLPVAGA